MYWLIVLRLQINNENIKYQWSQNTNLSYSTFIIKNFGFEKFLIFIITNLFLVSSRTILDSDSRTLILNLEKYPQLFDQSQKNIIKMKKNFCLRRFSFKNPCWLLFSNIHVGKKLSDLLLISNSNNFWKTR